MWLHRSLRNNMSANHHALTGTDCSHSHTVWWRQSNKCWPIYKHGRIANMLRSIWLMSATRLGCAALLQGTRLSQLPAGCILVIFIYKSKLLSACYSATTVPLRVEDFLWLIAMCWQSVCIYKLDGDYLQTFASQSESDSNRFTSDHECFNCHSRQPEN